MTPKERTAMQQALEALEEAYENGFLTGVTGLKTIDTINALREALAEQQTERTKDAERNVVGLAEQAEQEPVAWVDEDGFPWKYNLDGKDWVPLYAAPLGKQDTHATHVVRTKDLTDDEIMKINVDTASIVPTCDRQFHFARAVIAADREKNRV